MIGILLNLKFTLYFRYIDLDHLLQMIHVKCGEAKYVLYVIRKTWQSLSRPHPRPWPPIPY